MYYNFNHCYVFILGVNHNTKDYNTIIILGDIQIIIIVSIYILCMSMQVHITIIDNHPNILESK